MSHLPTHGSSPELLTPNHSVVLLLPPTWILTSEHLIQLLLSLENHDRPLKMIQGKWLGQNPGLCFLICKVGVVIPLFMRWLGGVHWVTNAIGNPSIAFLLVVCILSCFSRVQLFATLWTAAHQAPLSMGFSMHEYWSGLPCLSPGGLPDPGIELASLVSALAGGFFATSAIWEAHFS